MPTPYELVNHQEWLGYVQPVGLVVSAPAMLAAGCQLHRNMGPDHKRFLSVLPKDESEEPIPSIPDFPTFAQNVLGWRSEDLIPFPLDDVPEKLRSLEVVLDAYNETLRPTYVVPEYKPVEGESPWVMLIQEHPPEISLDSVPEESSRNWHASPHLKFERLLRETKVPFGIITNGKLIRIVYAPKGETSGYITFDVDQMATVAGRPIFAALHMLLEEPLIFSNEAPQRLPAILANSRKYQNTVSTKLAEQVMGALFELLRGFQAADDQRDGELLKEILANDPQHIYHGLLNVLMRMVFVLYAEDRGLISTDEVYTNHYSISGLFDRLRSDAGRYPDTMDQRYGAWAQLLTLFRLIHDGASHGDLDIPPRDGYLFDNNRYPFLEGRFDNYDVAVYSQREQDSAPQVPRVSDGIVYRVLEGLLVLDGERLSYRALDVEQIGSVYEAIMGFELEVAQGRSIAIKPVKKHGAPSTINLEALLDAKPADRVKLLKEWSDQKLTGAALKEFKAADSIGGIMNALAKKIDARVTPQIVPKGAMVFQPSDERRRSGSHYTPRSLTEPIVKTTLEPILKQLCDPDAELPTVWEPTAEDKRKRYTKGEIEARIRLSRKQVAACESARSAGAPHPWQILNLKICDPAMGSGAFLVEVCRQLADILVDAWHKHDLVPSDIPADEDELLYARRLVAQRCLYGVDKNVMAVDLAKLSLWLVTLARDHAFTFLDHSLCHGDSLVGLTREQIIGFHWDVKQQKKFGEDQIQKRLDRATESRAKILAAREDAPYRDQQQRLAVANDALDLIRVLGDACVSCFFAASKKKAREEEVDRVYGFASSYLASLAGKKVATAEESIVSKDTEPKVLISNNQPLKTTSGIDFASRQALQFASDRLKAGPHPVPAFHWEIEFPEVFSRENGGFDAFVGNPPFAGKNVLARSQHKYYLNWLQGIHRGSHGNSDVIAHFFRRSFDFLRVGGTLGFITTNTIAQGDTRRTGLLAIRQIGGIIFYATKRLKWPGQAAVVVSIVCIVKGSPNGELILNGKVVKKITAFLVASGGDEDPQPLRSNKGIAVQGPIFPLHQQVSRSDTTLSLKVVEQVKSEFPHLGERIRNYIAGEEFLNDPLFRPQRWVVDLDGLDEQQAIENAGFLFERVKEKFQLNGGGSGTSAASRKRAANFWLPSSPAREARKIIDGDKQFLMHPFNASFLSFGFLPPGTIVGGPHNVIGIHSYEGFSVLQSRVHEVWVQFFGSSLKDDQRYTPTDCFSPFPFPKGCGQILEEIGKEYYELRASIMKDSDEGLTATYNRFHDPLEDAPEILQLRELHDNLDRIVLEAYGWKNLATKAPCEFLLEYDEEEEDINENDRKSRKKKPYRYRWSDEYRDEVLACLLDLNSHRYNEERLAGKEIKPRENNGKRIAGEQSTAKLFD